MYIYRNRQIDICIALYVPEPKINKISGVFQSAHKIYSQNTNAAAYPAKEKAPQKVLPN